MTKRLPCPPAPGPLEEYAERFDDRLGTLAQRRGFREYLQGLLLPRDRHKTLTGLVGTEPVVGAQAPSAQRLQFFLSESPWDTEAINRRRLELLVTEPATAPHAAGVLVIDDSGDRKAGTKTAHVARQYLGSIGKVDGGIVAVTSLWADEGIYYPLHVRPYTPAARLPKGKADPAFRTKPQLAVELVDAACDAGFSFRAVVADCFYGENATFEGALAKAGLPYVVALKPSSGIWAPADAVHTPEEAARELRWSGPDEPGDWTPVVRRFRDGHEETWWAADLRYGPHGPEKARRVVVATTDPATLPPLTTWYLATNLPHPDAPDADGTPFAPADLAEIVRLYGLRNWVEQGYKQLKQELGWAGLTSWSAPTRRSVGIGTSSSVPSPSAGGRGSRPDRRPPRPILRQRPTLAPSRRRSGGKMAPQRPTPPRSVSWPRTLRQVRGWLDPWTFLWRCWHAWSNAPPPPELRALLDAVGQGHPLDLYLRS